MKEKEDHQIIKYEKDIPFSVVNIYNNKNQNDVLEHWHPEMEIVYNIAGNAEHYIDGKYYRANPGDLILINSESVHKVIPDKSEKNNGNCIAVVLIIHPSLLEEIIPNYHEVYFVYNENLNMEEISKIMKQLIKFENEDELYINRYLIKGLIYQLFHWLCKDGMIEKNILISVNSQKNMERLRGIIQYIHDYYKEPLTQREVSNKFYFTREYFSRFFKQNTGITFKEYLTKYRASMACKELMGTDKTISEIALDNGFADSRSLINAFNSIYGITPLQYRLTKKNLKKVKK